MSNLNDLILAKKLELERDYPTVIAVIVEDAVSKAKRAGYFECLDDYSIWHNGEQIIGCRGKNIKDIKKEFDLIITKNSEGE